MTIEQKRQYSDILDNIAEVLDITPAQFEEAKKRYEAVGKWLDKEGSSIKIYNPKIYTQGSIRLGTIIRPLTDHDQFDIDLVCLLLITIKAATQAELKTKVGNRLKENKDYERMLAEEKRRCWTLEYAEATRFHMDILPAIPNPDYLSLILSGVPKKYAEHAILITDIEELSFNSYSDDWPKSNPIGYALWFQDRMGQIFIDRKAQLAIEIRLSVEEVQEFRVRTPLQRAIQILKRHRDIMFGDDEDKPISIIITTLAAHAYKQEDNTYDALMGFFQRAEQFIKENKITGLDEVLNPVDPQENFADKWEKNPNKKQNFKKWIKQAYTDLYEPSKEKGIHKIGEKLKKSMGEKVVNMGLNNYGEKFKTLREQGNLRALGSGILGNSGLRVKDHDFYGPKA